MKKQLLCATIIITGIISAQIGCSNNPPKTTPLAKKNTASVKAPESKPAPMQAPAGKPEKAEPTTQAMSVEMQAEKLMNDGVDYIQTNKYPEALKAFHEILKIVKDNSPLTPTAYYNLACTYALMKENRPALRYLRQAIKAGYDNREAIEADPDLVSLHELPEYKSALDTIAPIIAITPTKQDEADQQEALKLIEDIRGLKFKSEPKYKIMAPDQFERAYGGGRETDSIQGFYRWDDKTLYLKQGLSPEKFKGTRIHETFHALQDQLYNTGEVQKSIKTTDGHYAILALIEGDATLTFIECMPESRAKMMIASATPWRGMMGGEPRYDKSRRGEASMRQGAFGYSIAARFVQAIKEAKGWAGVNAMYTNIPKSTEQVLHAEKYLANEQPVEVTVPDVATLLGAGWDASRTDTIGEFGILLGLLGNKKSGPLAEEAATGWAGDKIVMISNKEAKKGFTIHKTAWDTDKDAQEFFDASVLAMESEGQVTKTDNTATLINDKSDMDYLSINGTNVVLINSLPLELKDKVISVLK